jgi:hypothetical protein
MHTSSMSYADADVLSTSPSAILSFSGAFQATKERQILIYNIADAFSTLFRAW